MCRLELGGGPSCRVNVWLGGWMDEHVSSHKSKFFLLFHQMYTHLLNQNQPVKLAISFLD